LADNFTFPGGVNTYVPQLHGDLIVEYSRSPDKFPINRYCDIRKVDKQIGYYVRMRNDSQDRVVNLTDVYWADGNDRPVLTQGNDGHEFKQFSCKRYDYTRRLGYLAVEQGAWDLLAQESRSLATQAMTYRSRRVHTTLTTSGNYTNSGNASTLGGATWANATSTTPAIRASVMKMAIAIQKATLGTVGLKDLYLVLNPNTAEVVATSAEFIDFLKQSPASLAIWQGQEQFAKYNLPENLFGVNVVVDDTVYNSALPGATASQTFSFPDNVAILVSKQQAITPAAGGAFSTFELFSYEEMVTEVFNDAINRRYDLHVVENVDDSFLFAPESGYYIATNA